MPDEMRELRTLLTAKGVEWQDESDDFDRSFPFLDLTIYRTRFKYNGHEYVVSSGLGTLGGDWGLLEMRVDNNNPVGSLSANSIIQIITARG